MINFSISVNTRIYVKLDEQKKYQFYLTILNSILEPIVWPSPLKLAQN